MKWRKGIINNNTYIVLWWIFYYDSSITATRGHNTIYTFYIMLVVLFLLMSLQQFQLLELFQQLLPQLLQNHLQEGALRQLHSRRRQGTSKRS